MNIIENLKNGIGDIIFAAYEKAVKNGDLPEAEADVKSLIKLEIPKEKAHGDFACNLAMLLAKPLKMAPRQIGEAIRENLVLSEDIEKTEIAGAGFINF